MRSDPDRSISADDRPFGILPGQRFEKPAAWAAIVMAAGVHITLLVIGLGFLSEPIGFDSMGDFLCFYEGARTWTEDPQQLYLVKEGGYIYPPLLAFVLSPLAKTGFYITGGVWLVLMWSLVPVLVWLTVQEARTRIGSLGGRGWSLLNTLGVASMGYLAVAEKINRELIDGNSNMLVVLAFVLGLRWLDRRPAWAGLVIGLVINIKYLPLVFVPYLLLRRRWGCLVGVIVGLAVGAFAPALGVGWEQNLEFWRSALGGVGNAANEATQIGTAGIHPITWDKSASIPSSLARAMGVGGHVWLVAGLIAAAIIGWTWWLYVRAGFGFWHRGGRTAEEHSRSARVLVMFEWMCLIAATIAFSPQSLARHFNMAIPITVFVAALACTITPTRAVRGRALALIGLGLFALSLVMPPRFDPDTLGQLWRDVAGMSLGLLAMLLLTLPRALGIAKLVEETSRETAEVP